MKIHGILLLLVTSPLCTANSLAQGAMIQSLPEPLAKALLLNKQGRSGEVPPILERLVHEDSAPVDGFTRGVALNILGSAYRNLGQYNQARHNYEEAIHILMASSEGKRETASALNNLGGLECLSGQLNFARALHLRARHLYEILGDHAGMALASSNLTNVALRQNDLSTARRRMNEALKEVQLTRALDDENLATIDSVKGALSRSEGNFPAAITAYQQAIELETHDCGLNCPKLGLLYALRAESYGFLEDYTSAAKDFQKALSLLAIQGINSRNYLKTELAYASILRATGDKAGAVRMEIEAHQRLENLGRAQCNGCTITAESFR